MSEEKKIAFIYPLFSDQGTLAQFYKAFIDYIFDTVTHTLPDELVMFTCEFVNSSNGKCRIISMISDDVSQIGRIELFDNCIYSAPGMKQKESMIINNVKKHSHYLLLDERVNSEIFYILPRENVGALIFNAEFSSPKITEELKSWFQNIMTVIEILE